VHRSGNAAAGTTLAAEHPANAPGRRVDRRSRPAGAHWRHAKRGIIHGGSAPGKLHGSFLLPRRAVRHDRRRHRHAKNVACYGRRPAAMRQAVWSGQFGLQDGDLHGRSLRGKLLRLSGGLPVWVFQGSDRGCHQGAGDASAAQPALRPGDLGPACNQSTPCAMCGVANGFSIRAAPQRSAMHLYPETRRRGKWALCGLPKPPGPVRGAKVVDLAPHAALNRRVRREQWRGFWCSVLLAAAAPGHAPAPAARATAVASRDRSPCPCYPNQTCDAHSSVCRRYASTLEAAVQSGGGNAAAGHHG